MLPQTNAINSLRQRSVAASAYEERKQSGMSSQNVFFSPRISVRNRPRFYRYRSALYFVM